MCCCGSVSDVLVAFRILLLFETIVMMLVSKAILMLRPDTEIEKAEELIKASASIYMFVGQAFLVGLFLEFLINRETNIIGSNKILCTGLQVAKHVVLAVGYLLLQEAAYFNVVILFNVMFLIIDASVLCCICFAKRGYARSQNVRTQTSMELTETENLQSPRD